MLKLILSLNFNKILNDGNVEVVLITWQQQKKNLNENPQKHCKNFICSSSFFMKLPTVNDPIFGKRDKDFNCFAFCVLKFIQKVDKQDN